MCTAGGQNFALHSGDTAVFYGDSITAQRYYTRYAEEFILTRYPGLHVRFFNAGVPGDTSYGGYAGTMADRVQHDVSLLHPTMVTVMLGMNDGGYGYTPVAKMHEDFRKGYTALLDALHAAAPAAELTLINPTPYDEITHGTEFPGYSALVEQISDDVTDMAAKAAAQPGAHVLRADFNTPVLEALKQAEARHPQLAPLLIHDRIHPAQTTHWIMAAALMQAWGVTPVVSRVALDADAAKVVTQERAAVSKVERTEKGLRWTTLEDALPLPIDLNNAMTDVVLDVSDVAKLDQETLRVSGLPAGRYALEIDGKVVTTLSSAKLAEGVNLALLKTPMYDQARGVDWTEDRRMALDQARFILGAEVKAAADTAAARAALMRGEEDLDAGMREKLLLKPHDFELVRQR